MRGKFRKKRENAEKRRRYDALSAAHAAKNPKKETIGDLLKAQKKVVSEVTDTSKLSEKLAEVLEKYNAADKKGKRKLQSQLDKARKQLNEALAKTVSATEEMKNEVNADLVHEDAIKELNELIRHMNWWSADPADFWGYSDSARAWAHDHSSPGEWIDKNGKEIEDTELF